MEMNAAPSTRRARAIVSYKTQAPAWNVDPEHHCFSVNAFRKKQMRASHPDLGVLSNDETEVEARAKGLVVRLF